MGRGMINHVQSSPRPRTIDGTARGSIAMYSSICRPWQVRAVDDIGEYEAQSRPNQGSRDANDDGIGRCLQDDVRSEGTDEGIQ
jgi:hypothetical protein